MNKILYKINFDDLADANLFEAETEVNDQEVSIKDEALDIDAIKGATVWFKKKLEAPVKIEYTAELIAKGGNNDRVSDLNCFFMALDPKCPSDIFSCPDSLRTGRFSDYHRLRTYYVGYGGHDNSTIRMRRYKGYTKERPVLPEHDLGEPHAIEANLPIHVEISVVENKIIYAHDGDTIFTMVDKLPYHEGWFAFRTVRNHMKISQFKVTQLNTVL
ncbi:DUF6250 domain-containing protein [Gaetbulibacter sp. M240]|uniref:DUF6250 domain-containing protein n=1 Tax=Gaetbulibacter sp. M240 TaxID=3126511 RepID=UPI00374E50CC